MNRLIISLILGATAVRAGAVDGPPLMSLTGDLRRLEIGGTAGGVGGTNSYNLTATPSAPFADFATNIFARADWTSGTPATTNAYAQSGASQQSVLTGSAFNASSRVWGSDWVSFEGPYGPANPTASSLFDVSFALNSQVTFELLLEPGQGNYSTWSFGQDRGTAHLFSAGNIDLLPNPVLEPTQYGFRYRYSGLLDAGSYNLQTTQFISLPADPLGQSGDFSYTMSFEVTAVPEPSCFALATLRMAALVASQRRRR
jgi:hypothetical protein